MFIITSDNTAREIKTPLNYTFSSFCAFDEGVRTVLIENNSNRTFLYEWRVNDDFTQQYPKKQTIFEIEPAYSQDFGIVRSSLEGYTFFTSSK